MFCILRTAWISQGTPDQRDALEAGIAQQLKIGRQAVARLPATDHLLFAVGDQGRGTHGRSGRAPPTITASASPERSAVSMSVVPAPPAAAP